MSEQPHLQQTAPIDEYRVLWTTQKKQKLKKWHDGFLRFHKFNKRMLVYDDARHLVADMYLRGRDAIGEGDDLEFEHHLVTIEDFKETVVQDLTPLFTPAAQRKQQIQAGNALLNTPTPNQANRHGPWGPNRHSTPAPQSAQQRRPIASAKPPQTPTQRKPMGAPGLTLQQAARQGANYPISPQDGLSRSVQQTPSSVRTSAHSRTIPSLRELNPAPRPNNPQIPHPLSKTDPPRRPKLQGSPPQAARQPRQNPAPADQSMERIPFYAPRGQLSPGRRLNPPAPPTSLHRPRPSSPNSNNASRTSPRANKRTPDVAFDTDSDSELFGSPPSFQAFASPPEPGPASRQSNIFLGPLPSRTKKQSSDEIRRFRPPTKRSSNGTPAPPPPGHPGTTTTSINKSGSTIPDPGKDSKKENVFEPLVNAGVLHLNNATTRKRNKLLCQRPSGDPAPAHETKSTRNTVPPAKENVKNSRSDSISKPPSPAAVEGAVTMNENSSPNAKFTTKKNPIANHRGPGNAPRGSNAAGNPMEDRRGDRGKGKTSDLGLEEDYRIHEEEDTPQYQKDNDIGPWSSEAFDLFDWRPPNMEKSK